MAGPWGFNFRATLAYVTDGATQSAVLGELYPNVYSNGLTAGWIDEPEERDRNSGVDPRLAGVNQRTNDGTQKVFQVDLPSAGGYAITLAIGDADNLQAYQYVQVRDGATPVITIADADGTASGHFDDATGTDYDSATWPGSNTPVSVTLSGTTLNVVIGSPAAQLGSTTLAHLSIAQAGGGGTVGRLVGGTLVGGVLVGGLLTGK